jgi:hypothetical protein
MTRRAGSGSPGYAVPHEIKAENGAREPSWWRRVWQRLMPAADAGLVLDQLNGQLAVLEGARAELEAGWVQGGWWSVSSSDGMPRLVTGPAAAGGHPDRVDGSCLVGALVRAGSRLSVTSSDAARSGVGRAADAVYDALWASRGQPDSRPPGRLPPMPPPDVRLARVRTLTQWNDQAGRSREEVVAVVDHAISATIMDLMATPRPAQAAPAGARLEVSAR